MESEMTTKGYKLKPKENKKQGNKTQRGFNRHLADDDC